MGISKECFSNCYKCILINIGATIMGVKPAEMRNVKTHFDGHEIWSKCKENISIFKKIDFVEISQKKERTLVFFYNKEALDKQLKKSQVLKILKDLGYPKKYNLEQYIDTLVAKIKTYKLGNGEFPQEIGFFFGYHIKDVLGYMGYVDLKPSGGEEWRFYGDAKVSKLLKNKFDRARNIYSDKLNRLEKIDKLKKIV